MPKKPIEELEAGRDYYARLLPELDVEYFATMWHLSTVGHLVATDLDRIARKLGYSFADVHLLGSLGRDRRRALRATDLTSILYVSNAVLSTRVARLERDGLLVRERCGDDKRAFELHLTDKGRALIKDAISLIASEAKIVQLFRRLAAMDREALSRILGEMHEQLDRDFVGVPHGDD
ncbi:transcriptional regulator, MarR family [Rhizorhabdus wittichii RW1]|uniref:Transcriptional regulator, MarR family n=1 Tax=Rhizorhabdus wittichii (strain DSM 6014 / CCUG 31198 / JCM 15750 / NBRC 105917 / EY 4224 / RW1) TaxID=392499 RepID=A0A9J9H872_RHIWR|nr:transcriptional regulator, MarR family [Rhizorhabdus wittichii RW1]